MKQIFLLFFLLLLSVGVVEGAIVSGTVYDRHGKPFYGAIVVVEESKIIGGGYYYLAHTEENGKYILANLPLQRLTFSASAGNVRETKVLDIKNEKYTLDFRLDIISLPKVEVIGDRPVQPSPGEGITTPITPSLPVLYRGGVSSEYEYFARQREQQREQAATESFKRAGITTVLTRDEKTKEQKGCKSSEECASGMVCFGGFCSSSDLCQESDGVLDKGVITNLKAEYTCPDGKSVVCPVTAETCCTETGRSLRLGEQSTARYHLNTYVCNDPCQNVQKESKLLAECTFADGSLLKKESERKKQGESLAVSCIREDKFSVYNNPFVKATMTTINGQKEEDVCGCINTKMGFVTNCEKFTHVKENSCSSEMPYEFIECANGCRDGACVIGEEISVETCPVEVDNTRVFSELKLPESFEDMKERARKELAENGITREQREAYKSCVSEMLYNAIIPSGFRDINLEEVNKFISNLLSKRRNASEGLEDAWRFYLGLPQQHDTFGISDYRPSSSKEDKYYYKINRFVPGLRKAISRQEERNTHVRSMRGIINDEQKLRDYVVKDLIESGIDIQKYPDFVEDRIGYYKELIPNYKPTTYLQDIITSIKVAAVGDVITPTVYQGVMTGIKGAGESVIYEPVAPLTFDEDEIDTAIMWNYKLSIGQDERGHYLSYYDIWDLTWTVEGEKGLFGTPFEIYDRIYYDPETFEIIESGDSEKKAEFDLAELQKILEPEIDTSNIKITDFCANYKDEDEIIGSVIKEVGGGGCVVTPGLFLGYSEDYLQREIKDNELSKEDAEKKIGDVLTEEILYLVKKKFKPLQVKGLRIYLTTKDEIKEREGQSTLAVYYPKDNTIYIDFDRSPESALYHEYVHAYQKQLENEKYGTEIEASVDKRLGTFISILKEKDLPRLFLENSPYKDLSGGKDFDGMMKIIESNGLFDEFHNGDLVYNLFHREFFRYDFISEYRDFFETLNTCSEFVIRKEGYDYWKDYLGGEIAYGAYRPSQCSDITEFIAYLLQYIKYEPAVVYLSIIEQYGGGGGLYKKNLDLALKYNWITQEDYDNVINYGSEEISCDLRDPNFVRKATKVLAKATGVGNTQEFCQKIVEDTKNNLEKKNSETLNEVKNAAEKRMADLPLVLGIITKESSGRRYAKGPNGAIGLMQVLPDTVKIYSKPPYNLRVNNWKDTLHAGVLYFNQQLNTFGDERLALAAYNAGPNRVNGWRECVGDKNAGWDKIISSDKIKVTRMPKLKCDLPSITKKYVTLVSTYKEIWEKELEENIEKPASNEYGFNLLNGDISRIKIENERLIINPEGDEEVKIEFTQGNKIFAVDENDFFELTVKRNTKIVITDRSNEGKIPLVEVFTDKEEDSVIVQISNGVLIFDIKNTGSLISNFLSSGISKKQSVPMQLIVYNKNNPVKNRIISNYNELIVSLGEHIPENALDNLGDLHLHQVFMLQGERYQALLLEKNNAKITKQQVEECTSVTIDDKTKGGLTEETVKKLFDKISRMSPSIIGDTKLNLLSKEELAKIQGVQDAMAFVMEDKLGEIYLSEESSYDTFIDSVPTSVVFPHEYAHVLAFKIITSQLSKQDFEMIKDISNDIQLKKVSVGEGVKRIRGIEAKSKFVQEWNKIAGDVYGYRYLETSSIPGSGGSFLYKNPDGTIDESSISSSVVHRKSRYGTLGPYGLVSYHEDMGVIIGDYYAYLPVISKAYKNDETIRNKIEYLHSYGFFTDEQLKIIQNPPEDEAYFWQFQESLPYVSDCIKGNYKSKTSF